ncbi:phosphoinositide 5-phosphatase [Sarracenia purpurea var. burkii]
MVFDEKPKPYPCNKQGATILLTHMPSGDFDSKAASNLLGDLCLLGDREKQEVVNGELSARARKMDDGLPQPCVEGKGFATEEEWFATEEEWSKKGLKQDSYKRGESKLSDHRPVTAIFTAGVKLNGIQSFFRSERFEQLVSRFDFSSTNPRSSI